MKPILATLFLMLDLIRLLQVHPYDALQQYRESSGISEAKLVVLGMTSTGFTIADPNDAGMVGILKLIRTFIILA